MGGRSFSLKKVNRKARGKAQGNGFSDKLLKIVLGLGILFMVFLVVGETFAEQGERDQAAEPYRAFSDKRGAFQQRPPSLNQPPVLPRNLPPPPKEPWSRRSGSGSTLTSEQRMRLQERLREFRSMPPEKRQGIIQRWEEWKRLPPQERELYKRRFEQWKSLPREEQIRLRQKLNEPEKLTPQEKEELRRKFLGR